LVFVGRWPFLLVPYFFNPDESQQIAGSITLLHDPVFWRAVDGHTAGPFNFYLLSLPNLFGFPLTYASARVEGLLLIVGFLIFTYPTLRLASPYAAIAIIPLACFFGWLNDYDLVQISTEHAPAFLLSGALFYALSGCLGLARSPEKNLVAAGVFAGLAPWAKLQAVPMSLTVAAGVALLLWIRGEPLTARIKKFLFFLVGYLAPSSVFLSQILVTGQWHTFYRSYFTANAGYAQAGGSFSTVANLLCSRSAETGMIPTLFGLAFSCVLVTAIACLWSRSKPSPIFWAALTATLIAAVMVIFPRRPFVHYLFFLIPPLGLVVGASLGEWLRIWSSNRLKPIALAGAFCAICLGAILIARFKRAAPIAGEAANYFLLPETPESKILRPYLRVGDTLAVWGWFPHLNVELQLPQATRDAHSQRLIEPSSSRDYYRKRYLADLEGNRPFAFVDAVGPQEVFTYRHRDKEAHEIFPELKNFIASNYVLVSDTTRSRIYLRRDRGSDQVILPASH
jgi:hypothetical protein